MFSGQRGHRRGLSGHSGVFYGKRQVVSGLTDKHTASPVDCMHGTTNLHTEKFDQQQAEFHCVRLNSFFFFLKLAEVNFWLNYKADTERAQPKLLASRRRGQTECVSG